MVPVFLIGAVASSNKLWYSPLRLSNFSPCPIFTLSLVTEPNPLLKSSLIKLPNSLVKGENFALVSKIEVAEPILLAFAMSATSKVL